MDFGGGGEGEEEVGVDEGEEDHADAFDFNEDLFVFFDALDVAFVALVEAAGYADVLVGPEFMAGVDATFGGVVGG